jgi:hypothetical protein
LGVVALLEKPVDTTNRELETGLGRSGLGLAVTASLAASGLASLSFARHCRRVGVGWVRVKKVVGELEEAGGA